MNTETKRELVVLSSLLLNHQEEEEEEEEEENGDDDGIKSNQTLEDGKKNMKRTDSMVSSAGVKKQKQILENIEGLSNGTLRDVIENPFEAVLLLSGQEVRQSKEESDLETLASLLGGDMELAQDIYYQNGKDLNKARLFCNNTTHSNDKDNYNIQILASLCNGNISFAEEIYLSSNKDMEKAKNFLQ